MNHTRPAGALASSPLSLEDIGDCILFARPRLLGDIVFTLPALELFARHFPRVKVAYLTEPPFVDLVRIFPHVHEVLVMDRRPGPVSLAAFRRRIRHLGCRVAVDFHSGPHSALLTRISGVPHRIGYRSRNRNWAYTRLTARHPHRAPRHSVANQVRLLEHLGIPHRPIPAYPRIPMKKQSGRNRIAFDPHRVVVHVGAGNRFRIWNESHFHALVKGLVDKGLHVALTGHSPAERTTAAGLAARYPLDDLTGKLSMPSTIYLVAASGLYIGADSGPLHLASLTETPLVALYGPSLPAVSGPWRNRNVTILQTQLPCRPCSQRRCRYDTIRCMQEITPHDVLQAAYQYIS
ncbi:MAG TPA: glycosyltransferase family 9 protein [Candidatus Aminicenantes bacterium]|nr:glycosyltransferase family 9 protein [Candidatus Aminicenantes bacterium]